MESDMKIAVTYEDGMIFQHFGHTAQFKVYEVQDGRVISSAIIDTNGSGHGALAAFLQEQKIDVLICGGIGAGAQTALAEAEIKIFGGVQGCADEAVQQYLAGTLAYDPQAKCSHHGEGHHAHHGNGHGCGEDHQGCGGHHHE